MNSNARRLIPLALATALFAAGCSTPAPRPAAPTNAAGSSSQNQTPKAAVRAPAKQADMRSAPTHEPVTIEDNSAATGIAACDDYLASYKGCHRAAGIFSADTLDHHYQEMRDHLVELSKDPKMRDQLAARCTALANQLKQALHGKSCDAQPASASSSP